LSHFDLNLFGLGAFDAKLLHEIRHYNIE